MNKLMTKRSAILGAALLMLMGTASAASITYTDDKCSSFSLQSSGSTQVLVCNAASTPPSPGPTCSLAANPTSFSVGEAVTLTATCSPDPTSYTWTGVNATGNTAIAFPTATTTYTVQGANALGAGNVASVTVSLKSVTPQCTLTANPTTINAGSSSTLTVSCSPSATSLAWANNTFGQYTSSGTVTPAQTTTYSVVGSNASGAGNTASATVTVNGGGGGGDIAFPPASCSNDGHPLTVGSMSGDLDWNIGGGNPTYSKVMTKGQAYIYRFTTGPAQSAIAELDISEYIGSIPNRYVVISETPCDFDYTKTTNAYGFGQQVGIYFSVGQSNPYNYRQLKANTTYYVNIKNATYDAPYVDTCASNGDCRFIMFLRH